MPPPLLCAVQKLRQVRRGSAEVTPMKSLSTGNSEMKAWTLLALAGVSCMTLAAEQPVEKEHVERYEYGMELDVARVIQPAEVPNTCGVEPVQMVYEDHQGQRHTLEYLVMGSGCSGG